jgi:hypothetical protein
MNSKWKVFAKDHTDESYEVGRSVCLNGIYSYEKMAVFNSKEDAEQVANLLNGKTNEPIKTNR